MRRPIVVQTRRCVPIYNLMEDAATDDISRAQLWQWLLYGAKLDDGRHITPPMLTEILNNTIERTWTAKGPKASPHPLSRAAKLLTQFDTANSKNFMTAAYAEFA